MLVCLVGAAEALVRPLAGLATEGGVIEGEGMVTAVVRFGGMVFGCGLVEGWLWWCGNGELIQWLWSRWVVGFGLNDRIVENVMGQILVKEA